MQVAAGTLGVALQPVQVRGTEDVDSAVTTIIHGHAQALGLTIPHPCSSRPTR
jgi:hypothetical protein